MAQRKIAFKVTVPVSVKQVERIVNYSVLAADLDCYDDAEFEAAGLNYEKLFDDLCNDPAFHRYVSKQIVEACQRGIDAASDESDICGRGYKKIAAVKKKLDAALDKADAIREAAARKKKLEEAAALLRENGFRVTAAGK